MDKYRSKLIKNFYTPRWVKYIQPLNMIKNYYGEKFAFQFAFLLHYECWLVIPSIGGLLVIIRMAQEYYQSGNSDEALDTDANGILGLSLAIWATCFFESWKRKQKTIQYFWDCSDNSYSP